MSIISKAKENLAILAIFVVFLLLRLPGITLPYHQDEWKTAHALLLGGAGALSGLHHPPLTQIFFLLDGFLFGADYLRLFPLIFSVFIFILLFFVIKNKSGRTKAIISLFLFSICFYSVFASLMIDTDGSILPAFFLLAVYFYDKFRNTKTNTETKSKYRYPAFLLVALILGFLVKLSFIIAIGAIIADFLFDKYKNFSKKEIFIGLGILVGFFSLSAVLMYLAHFVYPAFKINEMISHAKTYIHLSDRNYFQSIIQGVKAVYYLSPLFLAPLLFANKEIFKRTRIFFIYLALGFVFYFILFDFSSGALDKYLMFAVVPLSAIVGDIIGSNLENWKERGNKFHIYIGVITAAILLSLNFIQNDVVALYPKAEWFSRVTHLRWIMLNPFTGGDGPLGFYVSFLFIGISFITSFIFALIALFKKEWKHGLLTAIIICGIAYNALFAEEFLFGKINGSAPETMNDTVAFISKTPAIKKVLTYNDSGAYELNKTGKYEGRFYAVPEYAEGHKKLFKDFDGYFMVIDIPHISENIFYGKFLSACSSIFETHSGVISGKVYDCRKVPKSYFQ